MFHAITAPTCLSCFKTSTLGSPEVGDSKREDVRCLCSLSSLPADLQFRPRWRFSRLKHRPLHPPSQLACMKQSVPNNETRRKVAQGGGRRGTHQGRPRCGLLPFLSPPSFCLIHKRGPSRHNSHLASRRRQLQANGGGDGTGKPGGAWVRGGSRCPSGRGGQCR